MQEELFAWNIFEFASFIGKKPLQIFFRYVIIDFVRELKGRWTDLANIKSAMKRVKVSKIQNMRNRMITSDLKTAIKKFDKALESDDRAAITEYYTVAVSKVDKAAAKGVIHKNAANRKKAQLTKKLAAK